MVTGEVVVQTRQPDHYALRFALANDYKGFVEEEFKHRNELNYPPFTHLVEVMSMATNPTRAEHEISSCADWVRTLNFGGDVIGVLGPTVAKRAWRGGKTRFVMLLKVPKARIDEFLATFSDYVTKGHHHFYVDVDPETLQ
jgi:primosomal protein N' (replication factor Y)